MISTNPARFRCFLCNIGTCNKVTVANNTCFNNYLDPYNNGSARGCDDSSGSGAIVPTASFEPDKCFGGTRPEGSPVPLVVGTRRNANRTRVSPAAASLLGASEDPEQCSILDARTD